MRKLIVLALLLNTNCNAQNAGKGNSTFIPDITTATKLLKKGITKNDLEKLLPEFTVSDSSVMYEYNSRTQQQDIFSAIVYVYEFTYAGKYKTTLDVRTTLNKKIKQIKYEFGELPVFFKRQQQLAANGYSHNEYTSKTGTTLNLGNSLGFYDLGNISVVLEKSLYKFEIFKIEK